jgi:hypothetical protein
MKIFTQAATEVFGISWQTKDWIPAEQSDIQDLAATFQVLR